MRLVLILSLVCVMQSFALKAYTQNSKISLSVKEMKLEELIMQIESQTKYRFAYNRNEIDVDKNYSVNMQEADIVEVLNQIFEGKQINFTILDRQIVLSPVHAVSSPQQPRSISGLVTDVAGLPLPGVTVVVKGTTKGTITDFDGNYYLSDIPADAILVFSFVGMASQEIPIMGQAAINVKMAESAIGLEEVVAIGYGTQKKSSMTASVASISSDEITKQVSSNVASTLQGRTTGVEVMQQAGVAGADVNIVIRGAASFGATEPLYIVDGAFSNNGLTTLNPNDIESIEILKDGAAAAIYGSRAANGVVLITTKKGKAGKTKVQVDASYAFQTPTNIPDFLNASEWRTFANKVADNSGLAHAPENDNPTAPNLDTDWAEEWIQYAPVYNLNARISGGGENSTFNASMGYFDQTGMTIYSDYKRYNMRVNSSFKKGIFSFSENISMTYRKTTPTTPFNISLPTLPIYDEQGRFTSGGPDFYINPEDGRAQNKIAPLYYTDRYNAVSDILGGVNASVDIFPGLKYNLALSGNYSNAHDYTHTPEYYTKYYEDGTPNKDYGNPINSLSESRGNEFNYTIDNFLSFSQVFAKHSFDALLGTSWMRESSRNMGISSIADLGGTEITGVSSVDGKISAGESRSVLLSFFSRLNYTFDDKYLLSASIRRDESSKFHKDNRVGYFPSISGGWNVYQEDWFKNPVLSKLKIRASYGELGANFLEPYNFDAIAYGPIPYTLGGVRYVDGRAAYLKSKELKWETAKTSDVGVELGFFDNKLTISADYFEKKNTDLLAQIDLNLSSGQIFEINSSREKPYVNTASVENKGFEFLVSYKNQFSNKLKLGADFNLSTLKNKVLALGENVQPITSGGISSFFNDPASITTPGEAIGSFYGYTIDGFDANGNFIFSDNDGNGIVNADDKVILGSPIPDFSYGFNLNLEYSNFDLTLFFQGIYGNEIFNAKKYTYYFDYSNNVVKDVLNAWSPSNLVASIPIMKTQNTNGGNSLPSEFYVEDGSYFRCKNVQLGYTLPKYVVQRLNIENLRVYAGIQNLFTITNYSGYDPEVSSNALFSRGIDFGSYPNARTFTLGFNLTF
ncbi:TonB-linked SusC/RagA family outer membrane protein [Mangrovibacterium marinum]|uniref:TonB-linked SusC/RagA family outer membrane protein n=2 Tax=Mangrovibacterium marinum TaxID=1639118 RepID=A0A2T5BZ54_9BACT|nr:TonB-linked SusC/RagA family outer membrane protein [Mangrovibacterium marinum]